MNGAVRQMINSAVGHPVHAGPRRSQPTVDEVQRRLQQFAATHDPSVLYPGLTEAARVGAGREIERVTRLVLAGRPGVHLDPDRVHGEYALCIAGHTTGLAPLLGRWIEDDLVTAARDVRDAFLDYLTHSRARARRIERE